uniref:Uncharacterized protein n=1 Tax=Moorena producens (strain JHB) TaxID=1454205 RepID=A0A1D9FX09_MOOP1
MNNIPTHTASSCFTKQLSRFLLARDENPWQIPILVYIEISNQKGHNLTRLSGRLRSAPFVGVCILKGIHGINAVANLFRSTDQDVLGFFALTALVTRIFWAIRIVEIVI